MPKTNQKQHDKRLITEYTQSPMNYKICLICKTIIEKQCSSCPDCYGYRFNESADDVLNHALTMATQAKTAINLQERYED